MKLERLVLENFCQHRHLKHVWHHGLNGIVGPNGSGKSNVVKAIRGAILGTIDNAGTKTENICQLADNRERSRIVLNFEHNGIKVEIIRVLRRGVSTCRIGSGDAIDGDNAVTAAVLDLLGVDQRILSEYIFVPQRNMAAFIDETPAERNKTFGQLFDLARADVIYKLLDAEIKRVNPAQPNPEIDTLRARVARNQGRRDELVAAIAKDNAVINKLDVPAAQALVSRDEQWRRDRVVVVSLGEQVDELAADLEARQKELTAAVQEQAELEQAKAGAAGDINAAQEALAKWEVAKKRREQEEALKAREDGLKTERTAHPEPQEPKGYPGEKVVKEKIDELGHSIRTREELLKWFKDEPKVCPTCGTETDVILKKVKLYKTELPGLKKALKDATQVQEEHAGYSREHARWQGWSQDHAKRMITLSLDQAAFTASNGEVPVADPDTCREMIDAGITMDRAIAETEIRVTHLRKEVSRSSGKLDEISLKHVKSSDALGTAPDEAAVKKAREALREVEPLGQLVVRAEGELHAIKDALKSDEDMLGRLEAAERKAEMDRLWVYHLSEVRKVMHHDRLPKIVAHNYLEILADDTNELLESFDADFRVSLGDGLNFTTTFLRGAYAGTVSPAQRLSEGQKVLLALAFRVAVNSLFAGTAGLLCLDEPTESLDERNLACLEVAIGKMRDLSESRGIQCLLVTHEPSFEVLFDGVLRLAG
jgi:DNA repair exonuclease SbcCD ATPase subunit